MTYKTFSLQEAYAGIGRRYASLARAATSWSVRNAKPPAGAHRPAPRPARSRDDIEAAARARDRENDRWATVLSSPQAKGRVRLACMLLAGDDYLSADKILAVLAASPAEEATHRGLSLRQRRASVPPASARTPDPSSPAGNAALIVTAYNKAVGH